MSGQSVRVARVVGPLSEYARELRGELGRLGYAPGSAQNQMRWVALPPLPATHVEGGARPPSTDLVLHSRHKPTLHSASTLAACDLVSHIGLVVDFFLGGHHPLVMGYR